MDETYNMDCSQSGGPLDDYLANQATARIKQLEALLNDYYTAAIIGKQMEDPTCMEVADYQARMDDLAKRTEQLLDLEPEHDQHDEDQAVYAATRDTEIRQMNNRY